MSLTVKVFYEHTKGTNEIRRFPVSIAQNVDTFSEIKAKIRQLFPALAHGNFALYWQDPDGDHVAFSTSEEIKDAMAYMPDGVLRVYVTQTKTNPETDGHAQEQHKQQASDKQTGQQQASSTKTNDPGQSSSQGFMPNPEEGTHAFNFGPHSFSFGPLPPVVTCDGCNSPISGLLYKCCMCLNYNLCQACAGKGQHSEHTMLRIPLPNFNFPPPNSQQFSFQPQPNVSFHFGPGVPPGVYSSASTTCSSFGSCRTDTNPGTHTDGQPGFNFNPKKVNKGKFAFNFNKVDPNSSTPFVWHSGIKVSCNGHDAPGNNKKSENYQHNWCGQGGNGCPLFGGMYWGGQQGVAPECPCRETDDAAKNMESGPKDDTSKNGSTKAPGAAENMSGCHWNEVHAEQDMTRFQIPTTFAIPLPFPTNISVSMSSGQPQPPTVTSSSLKPAMTPQPTGNTGSLTYITAPSARVASDNPQDVRIQASLNLMLAMGFSDTDGSLFALLLEHDGDIGTTIDALKVKASEKIGTQLDGR